LVCLAFDLADKYRIPAIMLGDGMLGQMMEPLLVRSRKNKIPPKPWALTGAEGRDPNIVKSFYMVEGDLEKFNLSLQRKYKIIQQEEERFESMFLDDAKIILVAYGTMARIAKGAVNTLRKKSKKIGLIRPVSLWPFPDKAFVLRAKPGVKYLVIEMSYGQMLEDVKLAVNGKAKVEFLGRAGGGVPTEEDIIKKVSGMF
ncbi:MAG: 3-methyl-2-oxobutanoate dehydrogenase subunit beta, partial [Candidatus Omnitrophica bacterium]|nr:3-methyl-2-oxobutanoate dehydrogenase subunit beta [Candidatus Omnitrophota bacterium]